MNTNKGLLVASAAVLAACSGGGGDSVAGIDGGGALPPVATDVAVQGAITGFGSVIVNGVRYDTSSAQIVIDGEPGTEADLSVGQVVVLRGTLDDDGVNGSADTVLFDDLVEGPIEFIDTATDTMVVLGQTVIVDANTAFEAEIVPASLAGLAVGDTVEVSGFRNSNGDIAATFIEFEDTPGELEVTGIAGNVDTSAMTFSIQDLVVDYSSAMVEDFPNGQPENGQLIEAEGLSLDANGRLVATKIEFKGNDLDLNGVDEVEIEGLITRFVSPTDFDVSGIPVTTTGSTVYEDGTSADLALDRRIEVEGRLNAAGVLVADKIDFEQQGVIRIGAVVDALGNSTLTLLGIGVSVDSGTEFDDKSSLDDDTFGFDDLNVGDYVELRAADSGGALVATRLEREDDRGEVFLRGFVETVNEPEFTILGVTISTNANTDFEKNDVPISSAEFFANAAGRLVEADGQLVNGVIVAEQVELED